MERGSDILTVKEAAALLQVSVQTVRRWADLGHLRGLRTPGNQRRFRRADVEACLAGMEPEPNGEPVSA